MWAQLISGFRSYLGSINFQFWISDLSTMKMGQSTFPFVTGSRLPITSPLPSPPLLLFFPTATFTHIIWNSFVSYDLLYHLILLDKPYSHALPSPQCIGFGEQFFSIPSASVPPLPSSPTLFFLPFLCFYTLNFKIFHTFTAITLPSSLSQLASPCISVLQKFSPLNSSKQQTFMLGQVLRGPLCDGSSGRDSEIILCSPSWQKGCKNIVTLSTMYISETTFTAWGEARAGTANTSPLISKMCIRQLKKETHSRTSCDLEPSEAALLQMQGHYS